MVKSPKHSLALSFILLSFFLTFACNPNQERASDNNQASDSILVVRTKITTILPIGWGTTYAAENQEIVQGDLSGFDSTFRFAVAVGHPFEDKLQPDQVYQLTFRLTSRKTEEAYLPGGTTGMMDMSGGIWELTDIKP